MERHVTIRVEVVGGGYDVIVGDDEVDETGRWIMERTNLRGRCAIITDSNVRNLYGGRVEESLRRVGIGTLMVEVPAGEGTKCLAEVERVVDAMVGDGLDRTSFVVAVGGGVVGDLAGFVAGIFYRGVPYVQVPTTVVAQVDSSVGGKTGVNTLRGKNLIGVFHQPNLVVVDPRVLQTLGGREYWEGYAEVVKHGLIGDPNILNMIRTEGREGLRDLIARNIEVKARVVGADERETRGQRELLNFGHTVGHAIEQAAGYGRWLHGEAVAMGMVVAMRISRWVAGLSEEEERRVVGLLDKVGLPTGLREAPPTEKLLEAMRRDKKFRGGRMRYVLLRRIGEAFVSEDVTEEMVARAIEELR